MVDAIAAPENGQSLHLQHRAYKYCSGECYWDASTFVAAFLARRRTARIASEMHKERAHWQHVAAFFGLPWERHYQASGYQVKLAKVPSASEFTRSVQCITTELAILVHVYWGTLSRRASMRDHADAMLLSWLRQCLDVAALPCAALLQRFQETADAAAAAATAAEGGNFSCAHTPPAPTADMSVHEWLQSALKHSFFNSWRSTEYKAFVLHLLKQTATAIEASLGTLVDATKPHHLARKRTFDKTVPRADDTYRAHLMRDIGRLGRAHSGKAYMLADGFDRSRQRRWISKESVAYHTKLNCKFRRAAGTFVILEDAARLDNPGKEFLIMLAWSAQHNAGCALPPQATPLTPMTHDDDNVPLHLRIAFQSAFMGARREHP